MAHLPNFASGPAWFITIVGAGMLVSALYVIWHRVLGPVIASLIKIADRLAVLNDMPARLDRLEALQKQASATVLQGAATDRSKSRQEHRETQAAIQDVKAQVETSNGKTLGKLVEIVHEATASDAATAAATVLDTAAIVHDATAADAATAAGEVLDTATAAAADLARTHEPGTPEG